MKITSVYLAAAIISYGSLSVKIQEAHAGVISSTVIPSETRRQGLAQENPCPGDVVEFTCTINTSSALIRWTTDGMQLYTFANPSEIDMPATTTLGIVGTLVDETTTTLSVNLSAITSELNGTDIGCVEVGVVSTNKILTIIGSASAPTVSVRPGGLSSLTVDVTVPEYGRECVDMYRATAVVGGETHNSSDVTVTDPTQMMYSFHFSGLDLCRDMLTNVTAVAVTNGVEGIMATPVTQDPTNRSRIITSTVSALYSFNSSGVRVVLSWQVIDQLIASQGFSVTCQYEGSSIPCQIDGNLVTQRMVLLPYDTGLEKKDVNFDVSYSYESCVNSPATAILTVDNVNSSTPQTIQDQRAVMVEFNEQLFDVSSVSVMFSSNCTQSVTVAYTNPVLITIPDTEMDTDLCQYGIQLVDGSSEPIGYLIIGYFRAVGLPSAPTPGPMLNIVGAIVGGIFAVLAAVLLTVAAVILICVCVNKKKDSSNPSGDDNIGLEKTEYPTGDEYAVVDTSKKKKKPAVNDEATDANVQSFYQDPNTIQHEQAPAGDLYAVAERPKKGSKKEKSEEELAEMYSVPDKKKKNQLTYADIDIGVGSGKSVNQGPQTEYATVVN